MSDTFCHFLALCKAGNIPTLTLISHETVLNDSLSSSFTIYTIDIEIGTSVSFTVFRRFRQFISLANTIMSHWPKEQFQGFPKNNLLRFRSTTINKPLVASRFTQLQSFLDSLTKEYKFVVTDNIVTGWLNPANNPTCFQIGNPTFCGTLEINHKRVVKSSWIERYCILKEKILLCYKNEDMDSVPVETFKIVGANIELEDRETPFMFRITLPDSHSFFFRALFKRDFIKWIEYLHTASIKSEKIKSVSRVGSDAYIPDECEKREQEKELKTIQVEKLKIAETLLRSSPSSDSSLEKDSSPLGFRRVSLESSPVSPLMSPMRSGSDAIIGRKRKLKISTEDAITQMKLEIDEELSDYLSEMNVQLVRLQFLNEKTNKLDEWKQEPSVLLCEKLIEIANEFLEMSVDKLCEGQICKDLVKVIQGLTVEYNEPYEKKFITTLLFILSPISRLVQFQKEESKLPKRNNPPSPNLDVKKKRPRSSSSNGEKEHLLAAISEATRFLFAAIGVSLIDSIKAQNAPLLSPVTRRNQRARSPRRRVLQPSVSPTQNLLKRIHSFHLPSPRPSPIPSEISKNVDSNEVKIVDVACAICSERFLFHRIYNHATYCQEAANACGYTPGGYEQELNWDNKLKKLDKLILLRIRTLDKKKDPPKNVIEALSLLHDIILETLNSPMEEKNANNILSKFLPLLNTWRNSEYASVFAYSFMIYQVMQQKYKSFKNNSRHSHKSVSKTTQTISITDFKVIKRISRGAFGRVDLVQQIDTGDLFAMKTLNKEVMVEKNLVNQVMIERQILSAMEKHDYVVRMHYAFHNTARLFLVMEYLPGGDCSSLLENIGYFEEDMARYYIAETIMALDYLHSKKIIHRDVKPDNLLISATGHIKLTDFGLSMFGLLERHQDAEDSHSHTTRRGHKVVGTPDYLPPEALLGTGGGKATMDWWSVGVTLFEFLTGIPPFNDASPEKIFDNILLGEIPWPEVPEDMSYEAQDLISKLLTLSPELRLGAGGVQEIKEHEFFKDINWETLYLEDRESIFVPRVRDKFDTGYFIEGDNTNKDSDSFVSGMVHSATKKDKDELFAGFSWVNVASMKDFKKIEESEDDSSSILEEEIQIAAFELEIESSIEG